VADEGSDTVSVISKATMTLARTIPLPAPSGRKPRHISASPDGRFVYVGESGANVVDVIDTATDQISARFSTGWPGSKTHVVVPDPTGAVVYAVNRAAAPAPGTLVALDAESGRWLWHLPLAGDPGDFIVAPDGRTGLLTLQADSRIDVIDLERHAVVKQIGLAGQNLAGSLEVAVDGGVVLITSSTMPAQLGLVELGTMTALPSVSLAATARGLAPSAVHLSYVPVAGSDEVPAGVVAVDTASRTVVRRFRLTGGGAPYAVVFDPK
jgi:YVTN family beta-propeller protein